MTVPAVFGLKDLSQIPKHRAHGARICEHLRLFSGELDHPACAEFVAILERTLTAVSHYQDQTTGLWWQILNQGDRAGNYLEASGTSMFVNAIAKGVRNGYLDKKWLSVADHAFKGLLAHLVTIGDMGLVDLNGICSTAGLGGTPYRDGSFDYYVNEPIITNDLHGVGAFLLASVEIEKATTDII